MSTGGWKWLTRVAVLGAVLASPRAAWAQSVGLPGATGGGSQTSAATINNAPTFDPSAQAAALLIGNYRVPGAPPVDPTATYRVPTPGAGGGSGTASTSTSTGGTTNTSTATTATASTTGSQ